MLVFIRPGYSAASCHIRQVSVHSRVSIIYACVYSPRLLGSSVLPHCDGPRSTRESLYACVHSPRLTLLGRQRSATLRRASVYSRVPHACIHSPRLLGGSVQPHCDGPWTPLVHSRVSVCLCSSAQVTWEQRSDTLRRALGLLESLCIVVFILVCGFAAVLDPLWKALLQALHSREIFSCTTDNRKRKKNVPF